MENRLNVIVAVLGCARADRLSCYGNARETAPFLDRIAREGVRFPQMCTVAPGTVAAHASLLTGLFPSTHGATEEREALPARPAVLPEILRTAGYRTAAFSANSRLGRRNGFARGFEVFHGQYPADRSQVRAALLARRAIDRLLRRGDSGARRMNMAVFRWIIKGGDRPFFAFLHYAEPHLEYDPPPPFDRMFLASEVSQARLQAVSQDPEAYLAGHAAMSPEDIDILTALYDAELRYVDHRLSEVADFLQKRGAWTDTIFILTADHGDALGEHGLLGHDAGMFDPILRVPLLIRCPGLVPQGYVIEEIAQTTDIFPTVGHLLGLEDEIPPVHGRPLIRAGRATPGPAFAIAERFRPDLAGFRRRFHGVNADIYDVREKAIRTKREKFIWRSDEENLLYDLEGDPAETRNLIHEKSARGDGLRRQLFDWMASIDRATSCEGDAETAAPAAARLHAGEGSA